MSHTADDSHVSVGSIIPIPVLSPGALLPDSSASTQHGTHSFVFHLEGYLRVYVVENYFNCAYDAQCVDVGRHEGLLKTGSPNHSKISLKP